MSALAIAISEGVQALANFGAVVVDANRYKNTVRAPLYVRDKEIDPTYLAAGAFTVVIIIILLIWLIKRKK